MSQASPYGQPAYYGMPAEPKVLSIASMCCGIAIFVGFGFFILPQIAAVILGHLALKQEPAGKGMAIAGLVMGYLGLALTVILGILLRRHRLATAGTTTNQQFDKTDDGGPRLRWDSHRPRGPPSSLKCCLRLAAGLTGRRPSIS